VDVALLDQQVRLFRHVRRDTRRAQKRTGREAGGAARSPFSIAIYDLLVPRIGFLSLAADPTGPVDRAVYRPAAVDPGMTDSVAPTIVAVVIAFALVTLVTGYLLGANWTQAVLVGGFASVVAAASAWLTARRREGAG